MGRKQMALIHYTGMKILYLLRNLKHCSLALYKSSLVNKLDKPKVYNCQNLSRYFVVISATAEVGKLRGRFQRAVTARALGFSEELYGHGGNPRQPSKPAKLTAWLQSQLGYTGCVPWATCSLCDKVYCLPSDQICLLGRLVHEEICPLFPSVPCLTTSASRGRVDPSPADLPNPGIEPGSPALQVDSLPTELSGKPIVERALGFKTGGDLVSGS